MTKLIGAALASWTLILAQPDGSTLIAEHLSRERCFHIAERTGHARCLPTASSGRLHIFVLKGEKP